MTADFRSASCHVLKHLWHQGTGPIHAQTCHPAHKPPALSMCQFLLEPPQSILDEFLTHYKHPGVKAQYSGYHTSTWVFPNISQQLLQRKVLRIRSLLGFITSLSWNFPFGAIPLSLSARCWVTGPHPNGQKRPKPVASGQGANGQTLPGCY